MADVSARASVNIEEEIGNEFLRSMEGVQKSVYVNAEDHGFWDGPGSSIGEKICLMHDELAEMHEYYRDKEKGRAERDSKLVGFSNAEEEAADLLIRLMDFCERHNLRLGAATLAKHNYNIGREYRHGRNY